MGVFARAVNRYCEIIEKQVGLNESNSRSVICYVGLADPRCHLLTIAALKTGHVLLQSAPRNSLPMHHNLFDTTDCHTLFLDKNINPALIAGDRNMKIIVAPELSELLDPQGPEPRAYPYTKTWDEIKHEPMAILHTSGSTGMPKPVYVSHGYTANGGEQRYIPDYLGRKGLISDLAKTPGLRNYVNFPPFHIGGLIIAGFGCFVYAETVLVFGPAHLPPTPEVFMQVVKYGNVRRATTIPAPLMELAKSKEGLDCLSKLDIILYGGGK